MHVDADGRARAALRPTSRALIRTTAEDWMARPWEVPEATCKGGLCKYVATDNHMKVLELAMDIACGPGIFRKVGLERLFRDARAGKAHPPADMMALESIAKFFPEPCDGKPRPTPFVVFVETASGRHERRQTIQPGEFLLVVLSTVLEP